jgi:hypothetical protein
MLDLLRKALRAANDARKHLEPVARGTAGADTKFANRLQAALEGEDEGED